MSLALLHLPPWYQNIFRGRDSTTGTVYIVYCCNVMLKIFVASCSHIHIYMCVKVAVRYTKV